VLRLREREATLEEHKNRLQSDLHALQQAYSLPDPSQLAMQQPMMALSGTSKADSAVDNALLLQPNMASADLTVDQVSNGYTPRSFGADSIPELSTADASTPALMVDLTDLGKVSAHKWCTAVSEHGFGIPWVRPDMNMPMVVDTSVPSLNLNMHSQMAVDFILE
jgi:hypothetical protein